MDVFYNDGKDRGCNLPVRAAIDILVFLIVLMLLYWGIRHLPEAMRNW